MGLIGVYFFMGREDSKVCVSGFMLFGGMESLESDGLFFKLSELIF